MQATTDQVLVVLDEATAGLAEREIVGRDAEDERLDEVQHRQTVVAVRAEAVGDVLELVRELRDARERVGQRRLRVREGERAGEVEAIALAQLVAAQRRARLLEDRQRAPRITEVREAGGEREPAAQRLEVIRALALAYAQAPLSQALAGIGELATYFKDISDSHSTNSHYCLSVLDFVESLVLGVMSDDLALGEAGRRFIEDDEHLIRRRLHRDLGGPTP